MRVALVCPYDMRIPGGVQNQVKELAAQLEGAGEEVFIVAPGAPTHDLGETTAISANRSTNRILVNPAVWHRVKRAISRADVVHVHEPFMPLVSLAALAGRVPVVATFHAAPPPWVVRGYRLGSMVGARLLRSAVLTAVSSEAARPLRSSWGAVSIIPNGIDVAAYSGRSDRRPLRVTFIGRDDPRKGLDVLLAAWPLVLAQHPQAELTVIGSHRHAATAGVRYLGIIAELEKRSLLMESSVLVAPNLGAESFGIVLVEGMAAGCALVASDLAPYREVAGEAAIMVAVGDVGAMAAAIGGLLASPDRLEAVRVEGLTRARRYDWSAVLPAYEECYRQAANRASDAGG
jgi:phosphatidylinositol alpha-mannosyltransferase